VGLIVEWLTYIGRVGASGDHPPHISARGPRAAVGGRHRRPGARDPGGRAQGLPSKALRHVGNGRGQLLDCLGRTPTCLASGRVPERS
jgi:hypothetical protein